MAKLTTLQPRVRTANTARVGAPVVAERRMTGRKLQARRFAVWQRDPHCAVCRRVVAYPHGFELDHIVPLYKGGADTDTNCQILCIAYEGGRLIGCHAEKTAADAKA